MNRPTEISPSTFFNYSPSKEAVDFQDDLDPLILEASTLDHQEVCPIAARRIAMHGHVVILRLHVVTQ